MTLLGAKPLKLSESSVLWYQKWPKHHCHFVYFPLVLGYKLRWKSHYWLIRTILVDSEGHAINITRWTDEMQIHCPSCTMRVAEWRQVKEENLCFYPPLSKNQNCFWLVNLFSWLHSRSPKRFENFLCWGSVFFLLLFPVTVHLMSSGFYWKM